MPDIEEMVLSPVPELPADGASQLASDDSTLKSSRDKEVSTTHDSNLSSSEELGKREMEETTDEDKFPDGGLKAWLAVLGAMCSTFATVGYALSWGVYQEYYQETILKDQSPSSIAWIGSIQYALLFLPGLVVGHLFDLGYFHILFFSSSALLVIAAFLTAQCTKYWQFLLCQGFAIGFGCSGVFGPTFAVIGHWFKKRRGLALGYVAVGASLGGICIPIAVQNLIPTVGFPWAMRIIGFILLVVLGVANLTMKRRLPPTTVKGGLFNLAAFKSVPYTIYCISGFLTFLGIYTLLTYVNVSAVQLGVSPELAFYYVAFANAGSLFGRWAGGILMDRIGPLNTSIPFVILSAILTYVWPFSRSTGPLIAIAIIYGFCSGAYIAIMTSPVMNLGGEDDVGRRIGMYMTILACGSLLGPPISGKIEVVTGGFEAVGLFAGSVIVAGAVCMAVVRYLVSKKWTAKV